MLRSQTMCHVAAIFCKIIPLQPIKCTNMSCGCVHILWRRILSCDLPFYPIFSRANTVGSLSVGLVFHSLSVGLAFQAFCWLALMGTQHFDWTTCSHVGSLRGGIGLWEWGWSCPIPLHHYHNHLQRLAWPHGCMLGQHRKQVRDFMWDLNWQVWVCV